MSCFLLEECYLSLATLPSDIVLIEIEEMESDRPNTLLRVVQDGENSHFLYFAR